MKRVIPAMAWSVALCAASLALADVATPATPTAAAPYDLERMVVSTSRLEARDTFVVPQSVGVVTDEKINATVNTTIDETLKEIPGVNSAPAGSTGGANRNTDYWNNGFSIRGLGAQRVLVLNDGVRQSGQGVGYGGGNLSLYDMMAVDRIEVVKGPSSVLYGTDAFGGVVQVFSHEAMKREAFGINGRTRLTLDDSRNTRSAGGYVDVGDKGYGLVIGGSTMEAKNPDLPEGRKPQGGSYTKDGGFVKLDIYPTADSRFRILANVTEAHDILSFDQSTGFTGPFYFKIPYYQRKMYGVEYERKNISAHVAQVKVGLYQQELHRRFNKSTPIMTMSGPPSVTQDIVETNDTVRTTELQPSAELDFAPHTITVGADIGRDSTYLPEDVLTTGVAVKRLKADAEQMRYGVYAQDLWDLKPHVFTVGARYDSFDLTDNKNHTEASESGLSGSVGYTYKLAEKTSLYATAATGFRSPDLDERYQDTVVNFFNQMVTIQGNADLKPERSYSFDAGVKHEDEWGRTELSAFVNSVDNFIGTQRISSTAIAAGRTAIVDERMNMGTVELYGFEAGWRTLSASRWQSYATVGRTWTDSPSKVAVPSYQFGHGIGYAFPVKPFNKITPSWSGTYVLGSRDTVNNINFPAYYVGNAQVAFEWGNDAHARTQLIVGVKNVFNALYSVAFFDQPQPARGGFMALQVDF